MASEAKRLRQDPLVAATAGGSGATAGDQAADDSDNDDEPVMQPLGQRRPHLATRSCPYLGTIDRTVLDFDFEKLCSVSLSHLNVYACLVCGKYFQGRGINTHAYVHSLDTDHRVFINLHTLKFYCLPDDYEVIDSALDDIKFVLQPRFTREQIANIDKRTKMVRSYDGSLYYPGLVGLNNIKANDYCNVVLHRHHTINFRSAQALSHVPPIRDYFLRLENYAHIKRPPGDKFAVLSSRFGELIRKLWNPRMFKAHVSPHEILQAVVLCSEKRFQITKQGDAIELLAWLLNSLHTSLNGTKKSSSSIIYKALRGRMRTYSRKVLPVDANEEEKRRLLATPAYQESIQEMPFLYLTMDLPPAPLYRDELGQNIIPQVPFSQLLTKFNGVVEKEYKTYMENFIKRFELTRLPAYLVPFPDPVKCKMPFDKVWDCPLVVYYKRFTKNQWYLEKNPTIVNFPMTNVDMYDSLSDDAKPLHKYSTYDLVANIVHDGQPDPGKGTYRIQLPHRGTNKWYELEDLHVKDILPQMITLSESYIQIWQLNRDKTREERATEPREVV